MVLRSSGKTPFICLQPSSIEVHNADWPLYFPLVTLRDGTNLHFSMAGGHSAHHSTIDWCANERMQYAPLIL